MTRMTQQLEKEMEQKGYRYKSLGMNDGPDEAIKKARELRGQGYFARAVECSTRVRGYRTYGVYYRRKSIIDWVR